jgi:hypothetical protein
VGGTSNPARLRSWGKRCAADLEGEPAGVLGSPAKRRAATAVEIVPLALRAAHPALACPESVLCGA